MNSRILELYSGLGGMHCAWSESGLPGDVVCAIDINTVANEVYKHNFHYTKLYNKNIQSLTAKDIKKLEVDTILMSPPCQPFTRNGKYLDDNDPRTNSFLHLIGILQELDNIKYILLENVKGFECSSVRNLFLEKLKECGFECQEFLLCPTSVGVPNSRCRYYCVARRTGDNWSFQRKDEIIQQLPKDYGAPKSIENIIEANVPDKFLIPPKLLKRANLFDICYKDSNRSCCFTKAYAHYAEGTGSVFAETTPELLEAAFNIANTFKIGSDEFISCLKDLKLRFFTPKEALSLMSFPKTYSIPESITLRQSYRLIGNSVNVKVISELLKILFDS